MNMTIALVIACPLFAASTFYFWRKTMDTQTLLTKANAALAAANSAAGTIATLTSERDSLKAENDALKAAAPDPAALQTIADDLDAVTAKLTPAAPAG